MGIVKEVRRLVQLDKIADSLEMLSNWAEINDEDLYNTTILLMSRYNNLRRKVSMGLISESEAQRNQNRLSFSILSTLEEIDDSSEIVEIKPTVEDQPVNPTPTSLDEKKIITPRKVFISYARKDREWVDKLERHLTVLQRRGLIETWDDSRITAGTEWNESILTELRNADIYIFMVSPDFLASDYIYKHEVPAAMKRYKEDTSVRVIPVVLRPSDWLSEPYGRFQALPKNALPITKWPDEDEAFLSVIKGIAKLV